MSEGATVTTKISNPLTGSIDSHLSDDARIFRVRRFLLREFPAGLTRASHHLQIYDNYITNTRLSLRKQRDPHTNERTKLLRQKTLLHDDANNTICETFAITEMLLTPAEYEIISIFETNETRKNCYFYRHGEHELTIDFYLGDLLGLTIARVNFADDKQARNFILPEFAANEVTHHELFDSARLSEMTLDDLRTARYQHTFQE